MRTGKQYILLTLFELGSGPISSAPTSKLSRNWATWNNRGNVLTDAESIF